MNPNIEFERFTQRVYQKLVNNTSLKPTTVRHNEKIKGKSGCEHQIDVYLEYDKDGVKNRVAIECKNYDSSVSIGKVRDFFGVLHDLDNVRGIMVTNKGYQKGAKKFAEYYGISLKLLREPGWNESIGTITNTIHTEMRHLLYLVDESWAAEHNFSIEDIRTFYAQFQFKKADYWKSATHVPIETEIPVIYNSDGIIVADVHCLGMMFLPKQEPGTSLIFKIKDGWIDSQYWGPVRIKEVKYEYESKVHETILELIAQDFVDAILKDAISGKTDYIAKY